MSSSTHTLRFSAVLAATLQLALFSAGAQTTAPPQTTAPAQNAPSATQAKLPGVTTTVVVHGESKDDYLPETLSVGTLDGMEMKNAPLSVTAVTRELLTDQGARVLSDVIKNDASVGEDYAPVGYYGDFEIRGFPLDLATGLQINGLTIAGEQDVPLENKQSVEFLKGLAGVESGVASAGGLINYVTKRPAAIETVDLATDQRGSSFGATDLGHFFGVRKQVGARLNLAGERIQSYVNGADGWRAMGAGAADWKIDSRSTLTADFEYQHKDERSVSGYELLGGTALPDITQIYPSTLLGFQSWSKPNTFDTYNASARYSHDLAHGWHAQAAGSYSHSLIDDNVIYAYGCSYEAACAGTAGNTFAPDGGYDIYDYRNPGELRIDAAAQAVVSGQLHTGTLTHEISVGGELFLRNVRMPGFYTYDNPSSTDGVIQNGAVDAYIGSENIYQPVTPLDLSVVEDPHQQAGPRRLYEDNHQAALLLQDRLRLPGHIQLIAASRYDALHNHNYSNWATHPTNSPVFTDKNIWLPQFAATYNPTENLTLYSNYGVLLSLGPEAAWWTINGNQYLAPFFTRQTEVGAKYDFSQRLLATVALFRMHAPFFYPRMLTAADNYCTPSASANSNFCFEADGHEHHNGIELNVKGKATNWLRLTGSATAMNAESVNTSTPTDNHKQVTNQPHLRSTIFADVLLPHAKGLHLLPGWAYTGRKEAANDDSISAPGYNIFNLGARYTPGGDQGHITYRIYADNITDKRYWKDTGSSYGDTFVHLGAPTTVRLSAHYTF
jgi:iron complex outermembrane receptor protein